MNPVSPPPLSPQQRVLQESAAARWWVWTASAWMAGLLVPCLVLVAGVVATLLSDGGLRGESVTLGRWLEIPLPEWLRRMDAVAQLTLLVGLGLALALLQAAALYVFYWGIFARAREVVRSLYQRVLGTSIQIAAADGITAQQNRTRALVEQHLPRLHAGLVARYRALPRSMVTAVLCFALAVAVDVWLTLLAVTSGLILWLLYRWLERTGEARTATYHLPDIRRHLLESVQTAPLVARVRGDEAPVDESGGPLGRLMEYAQVNDSHRSRLVPAVTAAVAVVVSLMALALGGSMLVEHSPLSLPAALVLALALICGVVSTTRALRYGSRLGEFNEACESVCGFIDRADAVRANERMILGGLNHAIEMQDVSLMDGSGRGLLDRVSLKLEPGSLVALLGTEPSSVASMVELLLGFGTPRSGAVRVDGVSMQELHERWLAKNVLWVDRNGPVWAGTIADNLSYAGAAPDMSAIADATRRVGVYDRLQALDDGFSTLLSADDGRLDEGARYGLAIARAWLRRPPVIIVQEPAMPPGTLSDDPGMDALAELARQGSLVIVLPQRLRTLRMADRVVLFNGSQLAGEGKHEELLASSDLYRHMNYVLFNPYRRKGEG